MAWMEKRVLTSLLWKVTHAVFLLLHPLNLCVYEQLSGETDAYGSQQFRPQRGAARWPLSWQLLREQTVVTSLSPISLCLAGFIDAFKAPLTS